MSLLDRARDLLVRAPMGDTWDDDGVEDVASLATTLATAWDPEPDDHRLMASRAATLGAFAAATSRQIEPGQGAAGRALPPAGAVPEIRRGGRRPAFILVTAGVLLVMSLGTVAASAPGGPLYDVRVAAEGLVLPQAPGDRATAQVARLQARVVEATGAAERGDSAGVSAALRAYARIATEAATTPVVDPTTLTRLEAQVNAQLEAIAGIGSGDPALEAVSEQDRVAAHALLVALGEPADGTGPGPGAGPSPAPGLSAAPESTPPPSSDPTPGVPGSPRGSAQGGTPTDTGGAAPAASPHASAAPGGHGNSPSPGVTAGPRASSGPVSTASPRPSTSPGQAPTPTPRASTDPSPRGGGGATPRPSGGSGPSGGGSGTTPPPGGRP